MADTTDPAVPTAEDTLTLAQQIRVNLLMLSFAAQGREDIMEQLRPIGAVMEEVTREEFDALCDVAHARYEHSRPPFGGDHIPPTKPFSRRTDTVEIDESAEALLARGNQAMRVAEYKCAYAFYVRALEDDARHRELLEQLRTQSSASIPQMPLAEAQPTQTPNTVREVHIPSSALTVAPGWSTTCTVTCADGTTQVAVVSPAP